MHEMVKSLSSTSKIYMVGQKRADIKEPIRALPRIQEGQRASKSFTYVASSFLWGLRTSRKQNIESIYARHGISTIPAIFLGRITGIPTIIEVNGVISEETASTNPIFRKFLSYLDCLAARKATQLITVTQGLKEHFLELCPRPDSDITVIPNGTNTEHFRPMDKAESRKKHGLGEGKVVMFVGTLAAWQGLPFLVESVKYLEDMDFTLLIVGSGPREKEIKHLVSKHGLEGKIKFTGAIDYQDIPGYINCADVCVAPFTIGRNMDIGLSPLKVYEYAACGKPVIASRINNLEFIEKENIGMLVEPENPEALAKAIKDMLNSEKVTVTMGSNARKLMIGKHSWNIIASRIQEQIDKVIDLHNKNKLQDNQFQKSNVIVFVSNPYLPDPRVKKEVSTLGKAGHNILIVARNSRPKMPVKERLSECNVRRITLPIPKRLSPVNGGIYYLRYIWRSYKYARRKNFDAIHCHDLYTLPIGVLLKRKTKKPLIYDAHEFYPGLHYPKGGIAHRAMDWVEKRLLRSADAVITVSDKLAEHYHDQRPVILMNCPEKPDSPDIDPAEYRRKYDIPERSFLLAYQGILSENRNLDLIVTELAGKLGDIVPESRILICGSGPLEKRLRKKARDNVIFTGRLSQEELLPLLMASDAGLLLFEKTPNNMLGLPNKLFEYMMVGLPSIVSELPVMARIVQEEGTGIVVDPGNIDEILEAAKELAVNHDRARAMGQRGIRAVNERYNWDAQGQVLLDLYK